LKVIVHKGAFHGYMDDLEEWCRAEITARPSCSA